MRCVPSPPPARVIAPPIPAVATAQDRVSEKRLFERLDIPTTRWKAVGSKTQLERALQEIGLPGVIKTRRLGYDGKGQAVVRHADGRRTRLAGNGRRRTHLRRMDSLRLRGVHHRGAQPARRNRDLSAERKCPLTGHFASHARALRHPAWQRLAAKYLESVLTHFRYIGILTIEFFVRDGRLIANEMAPRVHNSGHWTIEGAVTSQFENHLRAILNLPLGSTRPTGYSAMLNLIGSMPAAATVLGWEGIHLHEYDKEPRPGRKIGHCTLVETTAAATRPAGTAIAV